MIRETFVREKTLSEIQDLANQIHNRNRYTLNCCKDIEEIKKELEGTLEYSRRLLKLLNITPLEDWDNTKRITGRVLKVKSEHIFSKEGW